MEGRNLLSNQGMETEFNPVLLFVAEIKKSNYTPAKNSEKIKLSSESSNKSVGYQ